MTHLCVSKPTIIGSDNGLAPGRRQAIIWSNAGILFIGPLGTNFSEILIEMYKFPLINCMWKCRLENGGHIVWASMCWGLSSSVMEDKTFSMTAPSAGWDQKIWKLAKRCQFKKWSASLWHIASYHQISGRKAISSHYLIYESSSCSKPIMENFKLMWKRKN